jgi:hypothetical protein
VEIKEDRRKKKSFKERQRQQSCDGKKKKLEREGKNEEKGDIM